MTAAVAYLSNAATAPRRESAKTGSKQGSKPNLRVLDQVAIRRRARRRNAAILLFMVLLSGLFVVAFVHARLVATQQELDQTRSQIAELRNERARLERAVDEASSPALIVERAGELGMVRAAQPAFLVAVAPLESGRFTAADGSDGPVADESLPEAALGGIGDG